MTELDLPQQEQTDPLVDWSNKPTLLQLKQDLADAEQVQQTQVTIINGYLDNLYVRGKAAPNPKAKGSKVQPKLIRKQAEWRYAALSEPFLSTPDVFNVYPVSWEDRDSAQQNSLVLNNQFNTKINKIAFIDKYVRTGVNEGTIIVKVGWEAVEEEYLDREPVVRFVQDPSFQPTLEYVQQMQQESPSQFATDVPEELKEALQHSLQYRAPYRPEVTGFREVKKTRLAKNQPTVEICDYRNVIIDPTAKGDLSKANFVIYHFDTSLSELKRDGRYKNLDKINIQNNAPISAPNHSSPTTPANFNLQDKPRTKFVAYEYWGWWDIDGSGIVEPIVATWVGDTLIRMEKNPFPDKQVPFVLVPYLPVKDENYGEPDGALLEDNQKIIGAVSRGMIDILGKSANGQTGFRKDMLDISNRRKYENGDDYEFNPQVDPRQGVHQHVYPEIPNSAQFMLQLQNMEAESLTGVRSFSQGVSSNSLGEVAAGIRGALDAASKRELGILRRLSQGIIEIGRKIIAMNAEFLSEEEVVRVTNDKFIKVRRDDLPGNFDLRLSISTAEEDDNKARELAFMLQTMGNNMDPSMSKMILSDIARLRKMPDLAKKIEEFNPQPDPMQQQMQQLQMQLLQAQIAETQAKTAALASSAQLHTAKAGTESVKQDHIKADTDQKNLDFVEQEQGVKQQRDLQKIQTQGQVNQEQALTQHHLDDKLNEKDFLREYIASQKEKV